MKPCVVKKLTCNILPSIVLQNEVVSQRNDIRQIQIVPEETSIVYSVKCGIQTTAKIYYCGLRMFLE
jgi:hypothetical protein